VTAVTDRQQRESTASLADPTGIPLAEAKMAAPRRRTGLIERVPVLRTLDAAEGALLTLLAAPAGYGKTTAVRAWCAARGAAIAWVTLDSGDNDPARLWRYVATAVDRNCPGAGRGALRALDGGEGRVDRPIDALVNDLRDRGDELEIVLDDLHTVTSAECLDSIDYALGRFPPNVRLIVLTRVDPLLNLPRLRAEGALVEIRAQELAFTADEVQELLVDRMGIDLDREEIEILRDRTEGWPAAVFLAGYWLRNVDDPHAEAREFRGDQRFVADYLSREVISALDGRARWMLLRASVLGRFTAELCNGVFGRSDSAAVIDELERSNLFITRLEPGRWFRVHPLIAEFARVALEAQNPGVSTEIDRRAARWLSSHGFPVEAAEHAAAAGEHELVAELLLDYHLRLIRTGGARTLLRWTRSLPDEQLMAHPELAAAAATAATMIGGAALERRRLVYLAERAERDQPERFTPYTQAVISMVRTAGIDGSVSEAVLEGHHAVRVAADDADEVLVAARAAWARALYLSGRFDRAWTEVMKAIGHPDAERRGPGHAFARSTLALIAADRGWLASARIHAEKAKAVVGGVGASRSWLGANASLALGVVLLNEGSLADAEREFAHAEHFFRDEVATVHHAWLLLLLARARSRRGRIDDAEVALNSAHQAIDQLPESGILPALASEVEDELGQTQERARHGEVLVTPSDAEIAVLRLLLTDLSAREIGDRLYLSPNTVRSHTRAIYRKLGVNSRAAAVARTESLGLLNSPHSHM
jgi:ATP/maltotriose-dependent transcriptional regulator MalT